MIRGRTTDQRLAASTMAALYIPRLMDGRTLRDHTLLVAVVAGAGRS